MVESRRGGLTNDATSPLPVHERVLMVGSTQSGETADTLAVLRSIAQHGVKTLVVTNVIGSAVAREYDWAMYLRSGPELRVEATKTFSAQTVAADLVALSLVGRTSESWEVVEALMDLPGQVLGIVDSSQDEEVDGQSLESETYFFIGREHHHPVALEGTLKMKGITDRQAEGFPAGELKHGRWRW